jgi:DNA polymerase-4
MAARPGAGRHEPPHHDRHTRHDPGPCVLHIRCGDVDRARYAEVAELVGQFTPIVQAVPPDVILADVRSAVRYFERLPEQIALMIVVRSRALCDVPLAVGAAGNRALAAMAANDAKPGRVRAVDTHPDAVAAFLRHRPAAELDGVGPDTARTLAHFGLHTVGLIEQTPLPTLQRILGAATGRTVWERAHGIDPRPVTPQAPPRNLSSERLFTADTVDDEAVRRAVLDLATGLGHRLRASGQTAAGLTLTVRLAGGSSVSRSRTLPAPTGRSRALTDAALAVHRALGLQRARVRSVVLRAEGLAAAEDTPTQLSLDPDDEKADRLEAVTDQLTARFGARAAMPATLADLPARPDK